MTASRWWGAALLGLVAGMSASPLRAAAPDLSPASMLRSLQLVQDRIANGDQAALPMQRKLLEMIDKRLREASDADFSSADGFRAVLIYAMSGGNPTTLDMLMPRLLKATDGFGAARAQAEQQAKGEGGSGEEPASEAGKSEASASEKEAAAASEGESAPAPAKGGGEGAEGEADGGEAKAEASGKAGGEKGEAAPKPAKVVSSERKLLLGVYNYLRGRPQDARAALSAIDPMAETPELGAFVALVRGTVEAETSARTAMTLLDGARLLAPGSLIEEAALRRAAPLAVALNDRAAFLGLSEDYARRFLFSPYASQWADGFVNGVMALREGLDLSALDGIATVLDPERRQVLFLRIARRAAIEHDQALADFATSRADGGASKGGEAQARLYAALPAITSDRSAEALKSLETIEPMGLSQSDRDLLATAKALAAELAALPPASAGETVAAAAPDAVSEQAEARAVAPDATPPSAAAPPAVPAEPVQAAAVAPGPVAAPQPEKAAAEAASAKMSEARKTLADIDKLLEAKN